MTEAGAAVISVLVADDHAIVRKGLIELLSRHAGFGRFGEAASVRETLARAQADPWDVILLDLAFPDGSGIDALRDILGRRPDARVIILTMHPEDQLALRMLKAGAMGYLTKESAPEELVKAIHQVLQGGTYLSPAMTQALATGAEVDGGSLPHEQLSTRELAVMRLLAAGKHIKEIAHALGVSSKTVTTYRARLLRKMGMTTNAELTFYATRHGLLSDAMLRGRSGEGTNTS
ncbi:MAG: DNA-binding response regulator [Gemmatimonadetes bacterium]|nr:MAG: DNA-binding response regulator [Gemmatimonadota bacterium]PYO70702.1 MAG: DNA-binding response regulator [Gemmatimonadota bacterium]PYP63704.1 MAG: DNA-binding response regulator [Gemmatimonadota bacterium]